jgi:hypothetical protein
MIRLTEKGQAGVHGLSQENPKRASTFQEQNRQVFDPILL